MAIFLQYKIYTKLLTVPELHEASLVAYCNKSEDDHHITCGCEVPSSTRAELQTSVTL